MGDSGARAVVPAQGQRKGEDPNQFSAVIWQSRTKPGRLSSLH